MNRRKQSVEVRHDDGRVVRMKQTAAALYRYLKDVRRGKWTNVWDCMMAVRQTDVRKRASELRALCLLDTRPDPDNGRCAEYRVVVS